MFDGDEYEDQIFGEPNELGDLIEARPIEDELAEEELEVAEIQGNGGEETSKPKRKRSLNPQPKLDAIRLTGPRGLSAIEGLFSDFKFLSHGHEEQDLKRIMEKLELWGNRLFPKYQFDDLLEKVEKLGQKKSVVNFVNRMRLGSEEEISAGGVGDCDNSNGDRMNDDEPQRGNGPSCDDLFTRLMDELILPTSISQ